MTPNPTQAISTVEDALQQIVFPLRPPMQGPKVGDLREALTLLGFTIADAETTAQHYGASTRKALGRFLYGRLRSSWGCRTTRLARRCGSAATSGAAPSFAARRAGSISWPRGGAGPQPRDDCARDSRRARVRQHRRATRHRGRALLRVQRRNREPAQLQMPQRGLCRPSTTQGAVADGPGSTIVVIA